MCTCVLYVDGQGNLRAQVRVATGSWLSYNEAFVHLRDPPGFHEYRLIKHRSFNEFLNTNIPCITMWIAHVILEQIIANMYMQFFKMFYIDNFNCVS